MLLLINICNVSFCAIYVRVYALPEEHFPKSGESYRTSLPSNAISWQQWNTSWPTTSFNQGVGRYSLDGRQLVRTFDQYWTTWEYVFSPFFILFAECTLVLFEHILTLMYCINCSILRFYHNFFHFLMPLHKLSGSFILIHDNILRCTDHII